MDSSQGLLIVLTICMVYNKDNLRNGAADSGLRNLSSNLNGGIANE